MSRIDHRRDDDVHVRVTGELAVLGVVVGVLQVVDARADGDRAAQVRPHTRHACEVGQLVERQIHLARGPPELVAPDIRHEVCRGAPVRPRAAGTCGAGRDSRRPIRAPQLLAVLEYHAGGAAALQQDARDGRVGADLDPEAPGGAGDGLADGAGPAFGESPGPERAVDLPHVVVQQHVRRPRRAGSEKRADDPARRLGGLERVGLEPLVEVVGRAHRHELVERVERARGPGSRKWRPEPEQAEQVPRR